MKKTILAVLLSGITSTAAVADTIAGVYIGASVWSNQSSGTFGGSSNQADFGLADQDKGSYFIALEHPIPMLPNVKIASTDLETDGATVLSEEFEFGGGEFEANMPLDTDFDISYRDYTFYYEFFDNDLLSFDGGITVRDFDGDVVVSSELTTGELNISEYVPMLYAAVNVGLPLTGFNVFAEGNFLSYDDHTLYDYQAGVSYELLDNLAVDLNIIAGYRSVKLELDDLSDLYSDLEFDGAFAGLVVHF